MNNIYLRSNYTVKKILYYMFLAVLPLIFAGFYKNGIKLYANQLVSLYGLILPLLIDLFGFIIGCLVNLIYEKYINKSNLSFFDTIFSSFHPIYGLLIASVISINTNIFLFIVVTFVCLFISKMVKINRINIVALSSLIIIFIINLFSSFSFLNIYEETNHLNLVTLDYLLGRGSGGINTTHVLLLIFSLIILCNEEWYKKEIPLYSTIIYSSCILIYGVVTGDVGNILNNIFSYGILFSFVFIAPDSITSSYTNKGKIIFGIIIGVVTFGLFLVYPPLAALGAIVIASLCHDTLDKLVQK